MTRRTQKVNESLCLSIPIEQIPKHQILRPFQLLPFSILILLQLLKTHSMNSIGWERSHPLGASVTSRTSQSQDSNTPKWVL